MKKTILVSFVMACMATNSMAQDCKVLVKSLEGKYTGDCKSNKANGRGKAVGTDTYEGDFKSGYPEGKGLYVWQNKDWYDGNWKNGMREGEGAMHITDGGTKDSVLFGFWKKDRYVGKYEVAYKVLSQSQTISTVNINPTADSKINEIAIILSSVSGGTTTISRGTIPKIKLTSVDVSKGSYESFSEIPYQPKATMFILRKVQFPFTAHFRTDTDFVEIAFNQEGNYSVDIKVLN